MCGNQKKTRKKKTVRTKRKKTINAKIKLQDWWLLCCLNTPESIRSAYSNNLRMCVYACEDVCVYVCVCACPRRHTPLSFYYMGQWLRHLSSFTPLLSQTSHIARRDGVDVGGREEGEESRGGRVTTHIICLRAAQTARPQSSISSLLTSTSNIWSK